MNTLDVLIHALGWTLIHSIWMAALVGAGYQLFAGPWRSQAPQRAYAVGLAGLLALSAGLMLMFARQWSLATAALAERAIERATALLPHSGMAPMSSVDAAASAAGVGTVIDASLPWLVLLWALAVLALASGVVRSQWALRRLVAASVPLAELAAPVWELAQQFGVRRTVSVVSSACARVPFVIGHFAPVIVLPVTIATGMPWPQLRLILAHEIAHLRRADYLVNWLQLALEVLLFFHPVVRWLSEDMRRLREACCDDLVLSTAGGHADYARALLSLEEFRQDAPRLALSAAGGALLWRVQRIAGRTPPARLLGQRLLATAAILTFALGLLSGVNLRVHPLAQNVDVPRASLIESLLQRSPAAALAVVDWRLDTLASPEVPPVIAPVADSVVVADPIPLNPLPAVLAPVDSGTLDPVRVVALQPEAAAADLNDSLAPLYRRAPTYPDSERLRGRRVTIEMSYRLDSDGHVVDMQAESPPPRASAFVAEARNALSDWRFTPAAAEHYAGQRLTQRFAFRIGEAERVERCLFMTGTRICRK